MAFLSSGSKKAPFTLLLAHIIKIRSMLVDSPALFTKSKMFHWALYVIFAYVGLLIGPFFIQETINTFLLVPTGEQHLGFDPGEQIIFLLGTVFTTVLFALYQKRFRAHRYSVFVCVVGFFSFLPVSLVIALVGFLSGAIGHLLD
jgi:hypothetical protein